MLCLMMCLMECLSSAFCVDVCCTAMCKPVCVLLGRLQALVIWTYQSDMTYHP